MFFKIARFLTLGGVLACFVTISTATQPQLHKKVKPAASLASLDDSTANLLWHSLTKAEVTEGELSFRDEFDKRRRMKVAKLLFAKRVAAVAEIKVFNINVRETMGNYDFNTQSFHLQLFQGSKTYAMPERVFHGEFTGFYEQSINPLGENKSDVNFYVKLWYNILEEMREIKADERTAEIIQHRLDKFHTTTLPVMMTLFLKPISANEPVNNPLSYPSNREIFFEVTKFIVRIPAENGKKEIILKSFDVETGQTQSGKSNETSDSYNIAETRRGMAKESGAPPSEESQTEIKLKTVIGSIAAIDLEKNEITVKDAKSMDIVLSVDADEITTLKVGDDVKIQVKGNKAQRIIISP